MANDNQTRVPIYVIEKLGPEAVSVIERHRESYAVRRYETTLVPRVKQLGGASSQLVQLKVEQSLVLTARRMRFGVLQMEMGLVLVDVERALPGFDAREVLTDDETVTAVLRDARQVISLGEARSEPEPADTGTLSGLKAAYERAVEAHEALQATRVSVQAKRDEIRTLANEIHHELVSLRQTLRMLLGPKHVDCQRLRVPRIRASAEPPIETATEAVPSATASTTPTNGVTRASVA